MSATPELEPCPFCGNPLPPAIERRPRVGYYVVCRSCTGQGAPHEHRQDAIAVWNTRATPAKDAEIAELREALEPFAREAERRGLMAAQDKYSFANTGLSCGDLRRASALLGEDDD